MDDRTGWDSDGAGGAHAIEVESLSGFTWSMSVAGGEGVTLKMNHMICYLLRARVANTR